MESENKIRVEEDNELARGEKEESSKENDQPQIPTVKTRDQKQTLNSSSSSSKTKASNPRKNESRISVVFGRSTRPSLTQSLSFPGRTLHSDIMKRSIEVYPTDSDVRHFQINSSKVESRLSEGSLGSGRRRANTVGKKPFPGVNSNTARSASLPALTQSTVWIFLSFRFLFFFPF